MKKKFPVFLLGFASFLALYSLLPVPFSPSASGKTAAVASENPICSDIGLHVLRDGGSAMDAAIATQFCIGTLNMYSSGIGGGGFMLASALSDQSPGLDYVVIDFRETAPLAANTSMFSSKPELAQVGGLAVGVPGELRGLQKGHSMLGKLPWKRLVEPSINLALNGWRVDYHLADHLIKCSDFILRNEGFKDVFAPKGVLLKEGDWIFRKKYAATLKEIADKGVDSFYSGDIANSLIKTIKKAGGIMTHEDLENYQPMIRDPLIGSYRGKSVISCPAPASGAVLLSALGILDNYEWLPETKINVHRIVEAMKHAYSQRSYYGDPIDPVYRNISQITKRNLQKSTFANLFSKIDDTRTYPVEYYDPAFNFVESRGTSHISVLTKDGDAVSLTSTINLSFGSQVMDISTGIILNNQMDDFSIPGVPNAFGYYPSPYNYIHPGKRPLSSAVPTFILDNGKVETVIGASGGSRIISSTLQTLINMYDWNELPLAAVEHSRLHHQLVPNNIEFEAHYGGKVQKFLQELGHEILVLKEGVTKTGVSAIKINDDGFIQAAGDARKGGGASAF